MQAGGAVSVDSEWIRHTKGGCNSQADGGGGIWKPGSAGVADKTKATCSGGVATCKPLRRVLWTLSGAGVRGEVAPVPVKEPLHEEASEPN